MRRSSKPAFGRWFISGGIAAFNAGAITPPALGGPKSAWRARGRAPPCEHLRMPLNLALLAFAVVLANATAPAESPVAPASAASAAIELLRPGWRVLHCGVARGVLYVTYADRGQAAITPAVPNPAIAKACAAAGYPLAASAPQRGGVPQPVPRPAAAPAPRTAGPAAALNRAHPSFTPLAFGNSLSIDARNDSDLTWQCTINFSWTFDDNTGGPRSATTQATLAPRQNHRVVAHSGDYRNVRWVGSPSWFCNPVGR